jgi:hypothetical protein
MFSNRGTVVKMLQAKDTKRRVLIIQRSDGHYAIRPERWCECDYPHWFPTFEGNSSIFASIEIAEKEAYAILPWIRPNDAGEI